MEHMRAQGIIRITSTTPPVVEIDSQSHAAYVRFKTTKVVRTQPVEKAGAPVTIDFDARGEVVGIELIGVVEFSVKWLLRQAPVTMVHPEVLENPRYVPANVPANQREPAFA
jgi:uncharacterized protein YuzE